MEVISFESYHVNTQTHAHSGHCSLDPDHYSSHCSIVALTRDIGECLVAAWRSGNIVGRINEVTLRRARLVLRWVTVYGG